MSEGRAAGGPSGRGKGKPCFPPGTLIRMADESLMPIENIRAGFKVASLSLTGRIVSATVRELQTHAEPSPVIVLKFAGSASRRIVGDHKLRVQGFRWKNASAMRGLRLRLADGKTKPVAYVMQETMPSIGFNLRVDGPGNFILGDGIVAHSYFRAPRLRAFFFNKIAPLARRPFARRKAQPVPAPEMQP
jgi:hypothetical protein